jgi:imidazolonepropionase-like amidohydrolase
MITANPAKLMGLDGRRGTVEVGKDANFSVFKGVPARDMSAHVIYTVGEGKVIYAKSKE